MVSFRLTTEEYDRCRQLCFASGFRNVSEMVRAGVNHMLADSVFAPPSTTTFESRLSDLESRLDYLSLTVQRLEKPTSSSHAAPTDNNGRQQAISHG